MQIDKVIGSYPLLKYSVRVNHYTPRKSSTLEWLVLEILGKAANHKGYDGVPLQVLAEKLFAITDAEEILRPVLMDLVDMHAVRAEGLTDAMPFEKLRLSDLELTDEGREQQRKGCLPGQNKDDMFDVLYDVGKGSLIKMNIKSLNPEPSGIKMTDFDRGAVAFPLGQVREMLEEQQKHPVRGRLPWLQSNTEIPGDGITPLDSDVVWRDIHMDMECDVDGTFRLRGYDDQALTDAVLENPSSLPEERWGVPKDGIALTPLELGENDEVRLFPMDSVKRQVRLAAGRADAHIVRMPWDECCHELVTRQHDEPRRLSLVDAAGDDGLDFGADDVILKTKKKLLPEGTIYADDKKEIRIGVLTLRTPHVKKSIACGAVVESGRTAWQGKASESFAAELLAHNPVESLEDAEQLAAVLEPLAGADRDAKRYRWLIARIAQRLKAADVAPEAAEQFSEKHLYTQQTRKKAGKRNKGRKGKKA